jgi:hypothetical protein
MMVTHIVNAAIVTDRVYKKISSNQKTETAAAFYF